MLVIKVYIRKSGVDNKRSQAQSPLDVPFYHPQTKFAKVMFLHLSVILSTGG